MLWLSIFCAEAGSFWPASARSGGPWSVQGGCPNTAPAPVVQSVANTGCQGWTGPTRAGLTWATHVCINGCSASCSRTWGARGGDGAFVRGEPSPVPIDNACTSRYPGGLAWVSKAAVLQKVASQPMQLHAPNHSGLGALAGGRRRALWARDSGECCWGLGRVWRFWEILAFVFCFWCSSHKFPVSLRLSICES